MHQEATACTIQAQPYAGSKALLCAVPYATLTPLHLQGIPCDLLHNHQNCSNMFWYSCFAAGTTFYAQDDLIQGLFLVEMVVARHSHLRPVAHESNLF
jgi:hypothetical protein